MHSRLANVVLSFDLLSLEGGAQMTVFNRISAVVVFVAGLFALTQPLAAAKDHRPITITACVAAGARNNTFLLRNLRLVQGTPPAGVSADRLYLRLDSTKGLKGHVGHQVNVSGIADFGDIDKGTVEITNGPIDTVEVVGLNSERRTINAQVKPDDATAAGAPVGTSGTTKVAVSTYKLKVESVQMASASCS